MINTASYSFFMITFAFWRQLCTIPIVFLLIDVFYFRQKSNLYVRSNNIQYISLIRQNLSELLPPTEAKTGTKFMQTNGFSPGLAPHVPQTEPWLDRKPKLMIQGRCQPQASPYGCRSIMRTDKLTALFSCSTKATLVWRRFKLDMGINGNTGNNNTITTYVTSERRLGSWDLG